jgi:hypothetical protein
MYAQKEMPQGANAVFDSIIHHINKKHITWLTETAQESNKKLSDIDDLLSDANNYTGTPNYSSMDIDAMYFLLIMECNRYEEAELKEMLSEMQEVNKHKQELRDFAAKTKEKSLVSRSEYDSTRYSFLKIETQIARLSFYLSNISIDLAGYKSSGSKKTVSEEELAQAQAIAKDDLNSISELSDLLSLRIQKVMDRKARFIALISKILRKISGLESIIIENLK